MNHFKDNQKVQNFYIRDLFSIEELILNCGNNSLLLYDNITIKRLYHIYEGSNDNEHIYHEISIDSFDKENESHQTTLNYPDFIDYFNIHDFEQSNINYFIDLEDSFIDYCCGYIEQSIDPKLKPLVLKDLLFIHTYTVKRLKEIKNPLEIKIKKSTSSEEFSLIKDNNPNRVVSEVIDFLLVMYQKVYDSFEERYIEIYPTLFENIEITSPLTNQSEEDSLINLVQTDRLEDESLNQKPMFFASIKVFEIFERLLDEFNILEDKNISGNQRKKHYRDFSFIYRKMVDDGYIDKYYSMKNFTNWFSQTYEIEYEKLKTLKKIGYKYNKEIVYNRVIESVK